MDSIWTILGGLLATLIGSLLVSRYRKDRQIKGLEKDLFTEKSDRELDKQNSYISFLKDELKRKEEERKKAADAYRNHSSDTDDGPLAG